MPVLRPRQSVVVYDLGGGTVDACVVRRTRQGFEPLAYRGLDNFGGIDLDQIVVDQIRDAVAATPVSRLPMSSNGPPQ